MAEGFDELVRSPEAHDAVMPGWNGVFSAEALAKMYAALANDGMIDGQQYSLLERIKQITKTQTWDRDYVLGIKPHWRLGYHPAWLRVADQPRRSIGHYGFGGSGAWADPDTGSVVRVRQQPARQQPAADRRRPDVADRRGGTAGCPASPLSEPSRCATCPTRLVSIHDGPLRGPPGRAADHRAMTARTDTRRPAAAFPVLRAAHIGPSVAVTAVVALLSVAADLPSATGPSSSPPPSSPAS